ncbi:hypothetical protein UCREL1_1768 [Eutypa lata UCREL1]|uniref:Uncharacterized protein n=1 Tax=Eutypa lata (strain UCR-EL1) TaxID=1287681 RepID=M7TMQ9_EUTLA|nr:hypothetical protein UCREL1_1768 [Eutypa lata UCREL1]
MQFTITTLLSLLAATVVAAPVGPDVTALTRPLDQALEEVGRHTPPAMGKPNEFLNQTTTTSTPSSSKGGAAGGLDGLLGGLTGGLGLKKARGVMNSTLL